MYAHSYSYSYDDLNQRATIKDEKEKLGVALDNIGPRTSAFLRVLVERANEPKGGEEEIAPESDRPAADSHARSFHDYHVHGFYRRHSDSDDSG